MKEKLTTLNYNTCKFQIECILALKKNIVIYYSYFPISEIAYVRIAHKNIPCMIMSMRVRKSVAEKIVKEYSKYNYNINETKKRN